MSRQPEPVEVPQHLDELRRRLYRDGATAEDLRRYTEERAALVEPEPAPPAAPSPRRGRRHWLVLGAAVAVVLALAGGVALAGNRTAAPPKAVATEAAPRVPVIQDIGDGQTVSDAALEIRSAPVPVSVDGEDVVAQQFSGVGDSVVALDLAAASFRGGRVMVSLSSTEASPIAWRALRFTMRPDWTSVPEILARGTVYGRAGAFEPALFRYTGAPPSDVVVQCPKGLRWTVQVALLADEGVPE